MRKIRPWFEFDADGRRKQYLSSLTNFHFIRVLNLFLNSLWHFNSGRNNDWLRYFVEPVLKRSTFYDGNLLLLPAPGVRIITNTKIQTTMWVVTNAVLMRDSDSIKVNNSVVTPLSRSRSTILGSRDNDGDLSTWLSGFRFNRHSLWEDSTPFWRWRSTIFSPTILFLSSLHSLRSIVKHGKPEPPVLTIFFLCLLHWWSVSGISNVYLLLINKRMDLLIFYLNFRTKFKNYKLIKHR